MPDTILLLPFAAIGLSILVGILSYRSGRALALRKSGNSFLRGQMKMSIPKDDLRWMSFYGSTIDLTVDRADRMVFTVSQCNQREVLLPGLSRQIQREP